MPEPVPQGMGESVTLPLPLPPICSIDPSDQSPPTDCCHDIDNVKAEEQTGITNTIATLNDIIIADVPYGGDIYAAVADVAARADVDIDFRDIDVTEGVTLTDG